jgi:hypothetical protein
MYDIWFFVPKSGIAFIFISVFVIAIWNKYRIYLNHQYIWIFSVEFILFIICFFIADRESEIKRKK